MIVRLVAFAALCWMLGLAWFAILLPRPADDRPTDAIVVLTGAAGRIERGFALLERKAARQMLISGVDPDVRPREIASVHHVPRRLMTCCVTLGSQAIDTRSNAMETARWIEKRRVRSVRLITSDWHMRRARYELARALPRTILIVADAVPTAPSLRVLVSEYNKYLLRRAAGLVGI
jgi:uncharacterized SAM-binding protein YcdF (DUF218 family)